MENVLSQLIGQKVAEVSNEETLSILFDSGSRLAIYNSVSYHGCVDLRGLKGRTLSSVLRSGHVILLDFDGLKFDFVDAYPETASPEVAAIYFADGRIVVHQGEETAR
jgi:hypothetical protein